MELKSMVTLPEVTSRGYKYCRTRVLKTLYNKEWLTSSNVLHGELYLLNIENSFNLSLLKILHKHRNTQMPGVFDEYFIAQSDIHNMSSRHSNRLDFIKFQTNYHKNNSQESRELNFTMNYQIIY